MYRPRLMRGNWHRRVRPSAARQRSRRRHASSPLTGTRIDGVFGPGPGKTWQPRGSPRCPFASTSGDSVSRRESTHAPASCCFSAFVVGLLFLHRREKCARESLKTGACVRIFPLVLHVRAEHRLVYLNLLAQRERRHAQVRAATAAERVTEAALLGHVRK